MRTPPLKKLPTKGVLSCRAVELGKFSCRLCAPKRPPREHSSATFSGTGAVPTITGLVSERMSTSQTSFGASSHLFIVASSETTARPRPARGCTVWVQEVKGGENCNRLMRVGEKRGAFLALTSASPEMSKII